MIPGQMDHRIERTLAALPGQLTAPLSVATLARAAGLSPSHFAHLFRHEVGTSPSRYLHALRMIRARLLIERTSLSIKDVMAHVGCNDASHFSRDFRRAHGLPPSEWRRQSTRQTLRSANDDTLDNASVARIAALANEWHKQPAKPAARARAPDPRWQQAS
jgi:AraC-like DNA-binding protein